MKPIGEFLKTFLSYLKLKPRYLFGVAIVCFTVVLLPKPCREYLGYDELIKSYRGWISLGGICAGLYGLTMLMADGLSWILGKCREWRLSRNAKNILIELSSDEKECLAKYVKQDVSSLDFNLGDGIINGLEEKHIVYRAADICTRGYYFAFNLRPWVLKAFKQYPDLKNDVLEHYVQVV